MKKLILTLSILLLFGGFGGYGTISAQKNYPYPDNRKPRITDQTRLYRPPIGTRPERTRFVLKGDGFTDDTDALNAWGRGERVMYQGRILGDTLQNGTFLVTWRVNFNRKNSVIRFNTFVWKYIGYNRTDWINYGRKVRHYNNRIVDIGSGDNPYERILQRPNNPKRYPYEKKQFQLQNLYEQERIYKELNKAYDAELKKKQEDVDCLKLNSEVRREALIKQKLRERSKWQILRSFLSVY